jgi:hypothetical protein
MKSKKGSKRFSNMRGPIMTYIRIVEDLERIAMTESFDPILFNEILELKEELAEHGLVYFDGHSRPFRLVPAKTKSLI